MMLYMTSRNFIRIKLLAIILISCNIFCIDNNYEDIQSMLFDLKPFEDEILPGFLQVEYDDEKISNIAWFDQDSIKFTKIFHYESDELSLITEFRESTILKEFYFTSHIVTERFIDYLFGDKFLTNENYITEVRYNKSNFPIFYRIESGKKEYIGHIILNYDRDGNIIREAWFQGSKKIMQF